MIAKKISTGFRELPHTADWAIQVWADSPEQLFETAAAGMTELMEISTAPAPPTLRVMRMESGDLESLLVNFLGEVLYLLESERLACSRIEVHLEETRLQADLTVRPVLTQRKEIKAVTFHNLEITQEDGQFWVTIVFDV